MNPDSTPILDLQRTQLSGSFVQLDYSITIDRLESALDHEGVRVMKYEPDLEAASLYFLGRPDFMYYRFADIWLMYSECLYRLGRSTEALNAINELRTLRGAAPLANLELLDILDERGFELYWEGFRREDLIRFGQYTSGAWTHKEPSEAFRKVWPIPETALNVNPDNLEQNPGY